eukprot:6649207-Prymnesium_polylepis.3
MFGGFLHRRARHTRGRAPFTAGTGPQDCRSLPARCAASLQSPGAITQQLPVSLAKCHTPVLSLAGASERLLRGRSSAPGCGADRVKHLLPEPFEERLCGVLHVARIRHRLPPLPEAVEVALTGRAEDTRDNRQRLGGWGDVCAVALGTGPPPAARAAQKSGRSTGRAHRDRVWIVRLIIKVSLAVVLVVPRRRLRRLRAQGPPAVRHGRRAAACG